MGLCCLGALLGLCGFCARVELGGLKACGVFAYVFLLLPFVFSLFLSCPAFVLLSCFASWLASFPALLVFGSACVVVVVSFSLSVYTQKKGRSVLVRPLSRPVVNLFRYP